MPPGSCPMRGLPHLFVSCLIILVLCASLAEADSQHPLTTTAAGAAPKRVAIIGAGSAGSSTAYYLRQFAEVSINVTVFERNPYVGGRSTTVNVLDNPAYPVELGASIFVKVNRNLVDAVKAFGLNVAIFRQDLPRESKHVLGIWDGEGFVYLQSDTFRWWNIVKLIWRYGWAPFWTEKLMKRAINKFLKLYEPPFFPFQSLSMAAADAGLVETLRSTGSGYLRDNAISEAFSREVIQASTRVNYAQNLPLIHGLETMVCMATDGAVSVVGGNWQIFAGMLNASSAHVRLNTSVTTINRNDNGTFTVSYNEDYQSTREDLFDEIVIAGPLQDSNITISPSPNHLPRWIPYVTLHVTLFSSPHRLSGQFFNLASASVPDVILTTLPHGVDLGSQQDGVGLSGFWSISTLSKVEQKHYVYKVFSPQRLTGEFVARILGVDEPTGAENLTIGDLAKQDVSWFHEKVWHSYPYLYPRENFEEISLGPNIWYTGGIESFISAMETSSLMGRNVAGLMVQAWQKETRPKGKRIYQGKTEL
ncbi:hypothetical protein Egran_01450 [Elaphomyces granulatus]|uniref:Prenylcysteine lyase domain-containing protein n=1 Tax=Elaphomyces granulatus TaxID=519963 RepID=A0A232M300_9EURO|nr:hypothetical protein Egran_01450 [Elaphomyces granulatus]